MRDAVDVLDEELKRAKAGVRFAAKDAVMEKRLGMTKRAAIVSVVVGGFVDVV